MRKISNASSWWISINLFFSISIFIFFQYLNFLSILISIFVISSHFKYSQIAMPKWLRSNQRRKSSSIQSNRSVWTRRSPTITNSHWKIRKFHACAVHQIAVERSIKFTFPAFFFLLHIISHWNDFIQTVFEFIFVWW